MTQLQAQFARPADAIAYAAGDLVANSTVAGAVVPMAFQLPGNTGLHSISRARLWKSTAALVGAAFRLHLFEVAPVVGVGDNVALVTAGSAGYLGAMDLPVAAQNGAAANLFSDGARSDGVPVTGSGLLTRAKLSGANVYGLLEARGAYAPGNAEQFAVTLELAQIE